MHGLSSGWDVTSAGSDTTLEESHRGASPGALPGSDISGSGASVLYGKWPDLYTSPKMQCDGPSAHGQIFTLCPVLCTTISPYQISTPALHDVPSAHGQICNPGLCEVSVALPPSAHGQSCTPALCDAYARTIPPWRDSSPAPYAELPSAHDLIKCACPNARTPDEV